MWEYLHTSKLVRDKGINEVHLNIYSMNLLKHLKMILL